MFGNGVVHTILYVHCSYYGPYIGEVSEFVKWSHPMRSGQFPPHFFYIMYHQYQTSFLFQELQDFCFRFSLNHLTAVTQTEAFSNLDKSVMEYFIVRASQNGAFKY